MAGEAPGPSRQGPGYLDGRLVDELWQTYRNIDLDQLSLADLHRLDGLAAVIAEDTDTEWARRDDPPQEPVWVVPDAPG
jgi:hypothetical protein